VLYIDFRESALRYNQNHSNSFLFERIQIENQKLIFGIRSLFGANAKSGLDTSPDEIKQQN
jgi:hypothetical protein